MGAAGNVAGRTLSGWMSDALGRLNVLRLMIGVSVVAMPLLDVLGGSVPGLFAMVFTGQIAAQDVYRVGGEVAAPKLVRLSKPMYGEWVVLRRGGVVGLELDVKPDGSVGTVALVTSAGAELDRVATEAAKRFEFTPGMKDGKAVMVRLAVEVELDSKSRPPIRVLDPQPTSN